LKYVTKFFVLLLYFCVGGNGSVAEEIITIFTGDGWPPYVDKVLPSYGLYPRITTEAFKAVGVTVEYKFYPWKRSLEKVRDGEADAAGYWVNTADRELDFYLSDAIHEEEMVFYHLKHYPFHWETLGDLKDVVIGATIGYSYGEAFDHAERAGKLDVTRVPKDKQALQMLRSGRIDIFPLNRGSGYTLLQQIFRADKVALFTHHPTPVFSYPLHLLFPRHLEKSTRLMALFNEGLKRLKESGRYDQILAESIE